jgi:uncharacterized protein YgiM (DUF1202 family)
MYKLLSPRQIRYMLFGLCALLWASLLAGITGGARPALAQTETGSNWSAFFWNNTDFSGSPAASRTDAAINFNWVTGSPVPGVINGDNFSVRWSTRFNFTAGTYRFRAGADDGIRVAVNGQIIINRFTAAVGGFIVNTADVTLGTGSYEIIVDYYEGVGEAGVLFDWTVAGTTGGGGVGGTGSTLFSTLPPVFVPTATRIPVMKAVVIVDKANIRSGPGISYTTIAQGTLDQKFLVLAKNGDFGMQTWYLITLPNGGRGWIYREVIYPESPNNALPFSSEIIDAPAITVDSTSLSAPSSVGTFEVRAVARNNAMVREIPNGQRGAKVGVIPKGEAFQVFKLSTNRAWVYIDYNGLRGWTYVPNIKLTVGSYGVLPRGND